MPEFRYVPVGEHRDRVLGTVPVLVMPDGGVIDESLGIMRWALAGHEITHCQLAIASAMTAGVQPMPAGQVTIDETALAITVMTDRGVIVLDRTAGTITGWTGR